MALDGVLMSELNDTAADSAEQDQTARMCRLILLYTLSKIIHDFKQQDKGITLSAKQIHYRKPQEKGECCAICSPCPIAQKVA